MISLWLIILICVVYLGVLFWVAYYGDKKSAKKSIVNNYFVYALSLTTYFTAWSFYGNVGKVATSGISFITTYIGPVVLSPLWIMLFKKIIRVCKREKISSISDFIATRYGKDKFLGNLMTIMIFIFIIPYISIQLKAISTSFHILIDASDQNVISNKIPLIIAIIMSIFVILFGTRNTRSEQVNEGMVSVIAFEAIFKLIAFIIVGVYVTYFIFNGFGDIFSQAAEKDILGPVVNIQDSLEGGYWDWFSLIILSFFVFMLLPRQFHLIALENKNEEHVEKASRIFPLYLLAITLFVVPIAIAGNLYFAGTGFNADSYVLRFPIERGNNILATLVFLGGFSAATGMIIVETIAISKMLSDHIFIPLLLDNLKVFSTTKLQQTIAFCKKISIPIVLLSAYAYTVVIGEDYPLVETGLISFVGIVQLAPSFFGGLFWKKANRTGTILGIVAGFCIWFYTLLFPAFIQSGLIQNTSIISDGLFNIALLKPYALFGLDNLNNISHGFFWSITFNVFLYITGSLFTIPKGIEIQQANKYIDIKDPNEYRFRNRYKKVYFYQLYELIIKFIGSEETNIYIDQYEKEYQKKYNSKDILEIHFVDYMENILSDYIGNISARIAISKLLNEEPLNRKELIEILEETKDAITHSKALTIKSNELERIQKTLLESNEKLKEIDQIKDEFILTISHELRTPITSIRLLSEMLYNEPESYMDKKDVFLKTIIQESERLSDLIDDTLLQEKLELGQLKWEYDHYPIHELITNAVNAVLPISKDSGITVLNNIQNDNHTIVYADRKHLERVFINILVNAIKFNDPEKELQKIEVSLIKDQNSITICIEDNGIGIAKENHKKIFNTFVQVQNKRQKIKPKGSGLGLSIAKKIVEHHNGVLNVDSKIDRYTKFLITLPLKLSDNGY
ncbi:ATP-binding protein [Aquimarina algicola]|uniref:histidine kinase n=1 Tax=Aquimarina algicola TaxID=2589995 RepID=A0A504J9U1_9FLAO|nr:ATP-binding protein [Aquimarina algicola]TPN82981.1 GHKL domain-containing protein [Aquimarina algicola]